MDKLSELGTARGFARQAVERAERELERAKSEYQARDLAYQRYVADHCEECKGDGGWFINPDWPMGDAGTRQWERCPCGTENPTRRQELWTETNTAYSIARYGTPTG